MVLTKKESGRKGDLEKILGRKVLGISFVKKNKSIFHGINIKNVLKVNHFE